MAVVPDTSSSSNPSQPGAALLRLVQFAVLNRWRATGEDLYREVARLAEIGEGQEVLVAGCGPGVTTEWLASRTGAVMTGVDPDPADIERAEELARNVAEKSANPAPLTYQQAELDDLPYESNVFDAAIGEPEIAAASDPNRAVRELARVTKPLCPVVLLQVTWRSDIPQSTRDEVNQRLGLRPKMVVEWKQALRESGVVEIQVDDWTNECDGTLTDEDIEEFIPENWQDTVRAKGQLFRRSGWKEAKLALTRETTFWRELLRERSLCFSIIKGVKWPHAEVDLPTSAKP